MGIVYFLAMQAHVLTASGEQMFYVYCIIVRGSIVHF